MIKKKLSFGIFLFCFSAGIIANGADWPTFQHDAARTGITAETLKLPLSAKWIFKAHKPPARGWPDSAPWHARDANIDILNKMAYDDAYQVAVADNDLLFAASAENRLYCYDTDSGQLRWSFFTNAAPRMAPTIWKDKVYLGTDDGRVYCLDRKSGKTKWVFLITGNDDRMIGHGRIMSVWPIRTGVVIKDDIAYFGAGVFPNENLYLFAVNAETGKEIWRNDSYDSDNEVDRGGLVPQGYLLASDKNIVMPSGRICPGVFDRANGSFLYQIRGGGNMSGGSYAALYGDILFNGTHVISAFNLGKVDKDKWGKPLYGPNEYSWYQSRCALVADGIVYIVTDSAIFAVKQEKTKEAAKVFDELLKIHNKKHFYSAKYLEWQSAAAAEKTSLDEKIKLTELIAKNKGNYDEILTEERKIYSAIKPFCNWQLECNNADSIIKAGNTLFAGGDGNVIAIDCKTGKKLWSGKIDGRARGLAVADGKLFVSSTLGNIYCFGIGKENAKFIQPIIVSNPFAKDKSSSFYQKLAGDILKTSQANKGFCVIVGGGNGLLAYELAKRSELNIYIVDSDEKTVEKCRLALSSAGLYGNRINVEKISGSKLPYPPYFANLVIVEDAFTGKPFSFPVREMLRITRPAGGMLIAGQPAGAPGKKLDVSELKSWLKTLKKPEVKVQLDKNMAFITRLPLKGAGEWSHQFGTSSNTDCSEDQLAKPPFGVLWFADEMINPGENGTFTANGRVFMCNQDTISCTDAYNGTLLWHRKLPGLTRNDGIRIQGHNIAINNNSIFIVNDNKLECLQLDAASGKTVKTFKVPPRTDGKPRRWGWIAVHDGQLFGSRMDTKDKFKGWPENRNYLSEVIFSYDLATGKLLWQKEGKDLIPPSMATADGMVFFLDNNITESERKKATAEYEKRFGKIEKKPDRKGKIPPNDVRKVVAIDSKTSKQLWEKILDVTDCVINPGGGELRLMYKNNVLLVSGAPWNGHHLKQWTKGVFKRRSITALDAKTGQVLWSEHKGHRSRPIVIGDMVFAEPWGHDLKTGKIKMTKHPLTDKEEKWGVYRGYGYCGNVIASGSTIFFRPNTIGFYNVDENYGIETWGGQRPTCDNNCISGNGLVVIAGGQGHCVCAFALSVSMALYHKPEKPNWGTFGFNKPLVPVKHINLNLGAPGDKRTPSGQIWMHIPSRVYKWKWVGAGTGNEPGSGFYYKSSLVSQIKGTDIPWVYASGLQGIKQCNVPMTEKGQTQKYTIKLYFLEPDKNIKAGERVFDVSLQKKKILTNFDIAQEAKGPMKPLIKEFKGIEIKENLMIECNPTAGATNKRPILCGVSAVAE